MTNSAMMTPTTSIQLRLYSHHDMTFPPEIGRLPLAILLFITRGPSERSPCNKKAPPFSGAKF
jgi:hypothetical protein